MYCDKATQAKKSTNKQFYRPTPQHKVPLLVPFLSLTQISSGVMQCVCGCSAFEIAIIELFFFQKAHTFAGGFNVLRPCHHLTMLFSAQIALLYCMLRTN